MTVLPVLCRGCAGTGIGAHVTPREAQLLERTISLVHDTVETTRRIGAVDEYVSVPRRKTRTVRVDSWATAPGAPVMRGRMAMSGPLLYVIAEVEKWLAAGWELADGSLMPSRDALCSWCGGHGREGAVLTAHVMEQIIENGGT